MTRGGDLGFSYDVRKSGDVVISRDSKLVTTLRGKSAESFLTRVSSGDPQQVMARATGNYRRGTDHQGFRLG